MNATPPPVAQGRPGEVFGAFLKLGLTSFGGPVAHLGYFREELVTRRGWLSDAAYADLVALCQFLPGPASSQVGFALGMMRAGWCGAIAAFVAFTLPSALILMVFAMGAAALDGPVGQGALHGLKLVAVAIVAQAVLGMARQLCPDRARALIAVMAIALLALVPAPWGMVAAIVTGGLAGLLLGKGRDSVALAAGRVAMPVTRGQAGLAAALFGGLLLGLPVVAGLSQGLAPGWTAGWNLADSFYRAGALVFGGGHVVLPLLEAELVQTGRVGADAFLAGYGAAQAVPGPLFTFAAYLGVVTVTGPDGMIGAAIALLALFLPGFLILTAALPAWERMRGMTGAQSAMQGANAAVVGILAAALYSPVFTSSVAGMTDLALAALCFVLLVAWKAPPWAVVLLAALSGIAMALV
ncbi:chromate efflux transporter [Pseudooceanicola aestuarii]|uniref:chromate efflux transporter n=1 Tax=Pseudooceanicola aestuarii TaxID=2697319 RepID=UPI0013CF677A|nr:chromate efflux transporter [Pseudooceanicola aestuarii]